MSLPIRHASKVVVVDPATKRALILRLEAHERTVRGIDEWHLPGGSFEEELDDSIEATALREVGEEVGIKVRIIKEIGKSAWDALYEGEPTHFEATFFHAETDQDPSEAVVDTSEAEQLAWVAVGDMPSYTALTPEAKRFIPLVLDEYA